jgi:GAF domain-containing protein
MLEQRRHLEKQVSSRTKELAALYEIAAAVNQSFDLGKTLDQALQKTLQVIGSDSGGIYLLDDHTRLLTIAASQGLKPGFIRQINNLALGEGFSGRVALSSQPLVVKRLSEDPRLTRQAVIEEGLNSVAVVPLTARRKVLGTLFAAMHGYREFNERDIELMTSIGRQMGVAVENAWLYEDTKHRLAQLAALQETNRALVSTLELDALLSLIIQQAATLLQADGGILNLVDWEEGEDEVMACVGSVTHTRGVRSRLDGSLSGWVTLHNQPVISNRLREDSRVDRLQLDLFQDVPLRNAALAPMSIKDQVIGTLVLVDKRGGEGEFDQADMDLLAAFANQAATAIENARLYTGERRRAEQFKAIAEVSRRLTLVLDIDEVLSQVVEIIQQIFGYYHVGIGLIEGEELVYRVGAGKPWEAPGFQFQPARLKVGQEGLGGWVAAAGKPLLVPDVRLEPRYVWMQGSATCSELVVPIIFKEKILGVLDAQSDRLNAFDETDLAVFQSLAGQAGAAIENARLFRAEQRRAEQFRVIGEVGRRTTSSLSVLDLLDQMARLIQESFGYYHVGIGLIEGQDVVSIAEVGACEDVYRNARVEMGLGCWGWVARHGEPLLLGDLRLTPHFTSIPEAGEILSHLCVPLRTKDGVIGVISAASDRVNAFDESDQSVLQSLAHQAAVAVENIRFYERAQQMAVIEERSRLARELHDAVTQTLFSASLVAEALPTAWENDPQEGRNLLQELRTLSRGALAEMRTLLLELRPAALVETRLEDLLRQLGEAASGREGIPVMVLVENGPPPHIKDQIPPDVHIALYRIAQEALNNVVKHARASQATVRLCYTCGDGEGTSLSVLLSMGDNGRGFDPVRVPQNRLGIGIMQERAQAIGATLSIDSHSGEGTQVTVLWEQKRE